MEDRLPDVSGGSGKVESRPVLVVDAEGEPVEFENNESIEQLLIQNNILLSQILDHLQNGTISTSGL